MQRRPVALVASLVVAGLLGGCAAVGELFRSADDAVVVALQTDPLYEELVPFYVELCAVSQYRPKFKASYGASPGHAVMYLKGACRDEAASYPRLRPCARNESDPASPEHGAGISVNKWFKNVNWVATPGKRLFFDGNLAAYQTLDRAHFDATVREAVELGIFDGVEIHGPESGGPDVESVEAFVANDSMSTDLAVRFGRSAFCARVPMNRAMMDRTREFLNGLNDQYRGEHEYRWSGYADNCTHTLHNALAAAGIWKPKSVRAIKIRQLFNLSIPSNTFVDLLFLTNRYPIEDFDAIWRDELRRTMLLEEGWLPATPGALAQTLPVHQDNELFDTKYRLLVLEGWFRRPTQERARELLEDGRVTQLDANLRSFRDRYDAILAHRRSAAGRGRGDDAYRRARDAYDAYVERERAAMGEALARLAELDAIRTELLDDAYQEWRRRVPTQPLP